MLKVECRLEEQEGEWCSDGLSHLPPRALSRHMAPPLVPSQVGCSLQRPQPWGRGRNGARSTASAGAPSVLPAAGGQRWVPGSDLKEKA